MDAMQPWIKYCLKLTSQPLNEEPTRRKALGEAQTVADYGAGVPVCALL